MTESASSARVLTPRRSRTARGALVIIVLVTLGAAAWYARATLLWSAAELWIVSEPVEPADAVAIFGGGLSVRPFAAAEYYHQGLAKKILVANVRPERSETLGGLPSHTDRNRSVLMKLGVPEAAIEVFGTELSNTYLEAVALREWATRSGARTVIVPTELFSSRRVRWVSRHVFVGMAARVQVVALDHSEYSRDAWWQSEHGLISFQTEVIKYVYYRLKY